MTNEKIKPNQQGPGGGEAPVEDIEYIGQFLIICLLLLWASSHIVIAIIGSGNSNAGDLHTHDP
jgi:hypothetical protein